MPEESADKRKEKSKEKTKDTSAEKTAEKTSGPTKSEFEQLSSAVKKLQAENKDLRRKLKRRRDSSSSSSSSSTSSSSSSSSSGDDDDEEKKPREVPILDQSMSKHEKKKFVHANLPFNYNDTFVSIIKDKEGNKVLRHILQEALRTAMEKEEGTYDTAMRSRVLAHKVVNTLFTSDYIKVFKMFDPRQNYHQRKGTAMTEDVYTWIMTTVEDEAIQHFKKFGQPNRFIWKEFLDKLRELWKWARNNMRKAKVKAEKKKKKMSAMAKEKKKRKEDSKQKGLKESKAKYKKRK